MTSKQAVLKLYKNRGETPLECLERFKKNNSEYKEERMTYAGRLDPLAGGLLLVIVGNEYKNKENYLKLDKEYELDILLGFATDSYDLLGKVTKIAEKSFTYDVKDFSAILNTFVKKFKQKYPPYSSKYFAKARSGELNEEEISEKEVEIKSIKFLDKKIISKNDLEKYINESILLVNGDFRQGEILNIWSQIFRQDLKSKTFPIISLRVSCTSGTYMRSLANSIGEIIGIPALALMIKRTKIGKYKI